MGGRGGSMGGSHGMGGGSSAGGAAKTAAPAAPQTREQQLLAQIMGNHTGTQWGASELKTIWLTSSGYNVYDAGQYKVAYSRKALTICKTVKSRQQVVHGGINW